MATSSTTFSKDTQPKRGRGKSERTKILEAMGRMDDPKTQDDFYDLLAKRAFDPEDTFTFKELLNRLSPIPKATSPLVQFEFDETATSHIQAKQVIKAMADGLIPSDLGKLFVDSIQAMLKIQEVTDIDDRLKAIEELAKNGE